MIKKLLLALIPFIVLTSLEARTWTNTKGKKIEARFIRTVGDDYVILLVGTKEYKIYVWDLSPADRDWIKENKDKAPDASADGNSPSNDVAPNKNKPKLTSPDKKIEATLLGVALKEGKNIIPLDTSAYPFIKVNKAHSVQSEIILYLPKGFDPSRQYKLMVTTATSSGKASQKGSVAPFGNVGNKHGWVVLTADSVNGRPPDFNANYRLQMIDAALDKMHEEWPASKTWKIAAGGSSGGAKAAQTLLMQLGSRKWGRHHIVGLFLSGCNQCFTSDMKRSHSAGRKEKRNVAIFFSQGLKDTIADPSSGKAVCAALKKDGMRIQKYAEHDGGHGMHRPHIEEAFIWIGKHADQLPVKTIK